MCLFEGNVVIEYWFTILPIGVLCFLLFWLFIVFDMKDVMRKSLFISVIIFNLIFMPSVAFAVDSSPDSEDVSHLMSLNVSVLDSGSLTVREAFFSNPQTLDDGFAKVIIHFQKNTKTISVAKQKLLLDVLVENGLDKLEYTSASGAQVDLTKTRLILGETRNLYAKNVEAATENVTIPFPTVQNVSSSLTQCIDLTVQDGKDGVGLKTIITTTDSNTGEITKEEVLSVVSKPVSKIVSLRNPDCEDPTFTPERFRVKRDGLSSEEIGVLSKTGVDTSSQAVNLALSKVGSPYIWANTGPNAFDCSGLIYWIYKTNLGVNLPRTAWEQGAYATEQVSLADIKPGDVLYNRGHIILYVGGGKVVHASSPSRGVVLDPAAWYLDGSYKAARIFPMPATEKPIENKPLPTAQPPVAPVVPKIVHSAPPLIEASPLPTMPVFDSLEPVTPVSVAPSN